MANAPREGVLFCPVMANTNGSRFYLMEQARSMIDFEVLYAPSGFYDWLYITALYEHREWLRRQSLNTAGFTNIEFNPERSINCQARSCALLVTLLKNGWIDEAVSSPGAFIKLLSSRNYRPDHSHRTQPMFR
jgi:hypothetical protein